MTPAEAAQVATHVAVIWETFGKDRPAMVEAWKPYLVKLDYLETKRVVEALVVADDKKAPRIGTIVRGVIDRTNPPTYPSVEKAWKLATELITANQCGAPFDVPHELVTAAINEVGATDVAKGYPSGFKAAYNRLVDLADAERYAA